MITYLLESLTIQLVFLLAYDLFLKKETFLQWNRAYLLGTFILSLLLPWVKIEAFKTTIPESLVQYQQFFWQLDEVVLSTNASQSGFWQDINWTFVVLGAGSLSMIVWLVVKLNRIYKLKRNGVVSRERDFIKVVILESEQAFSFFKNVFLGESIPKEKQENILVHEMVHVKQWHSLDLMFFEIMRIVFWFNPLVYLYQNRISELHEFIADAQASKTNKRVQYELLLSEVFQIQNFSLVNQFFKQSLIKKRIVMLTKKKSKSIYQFKYALLMPLVLGMLIYTSCDSGSIQNGTQEDSLSSQIAALQEEIEAKEQLSSNELEALSSLSNTFTDKLKQTMSTSDGWTVAMGVDGAQGVSGDIFPFAVVDEAPVFPGCENAEDKKDCFQVKMQEHIRKHFNYPKEAQELGIQGRVNVIFKISSEGDIIDIRKRGPHKLLEDEVARIISRLPKMQPGKQKGQVVNVPFSIPITFKLD
ncbi:M56 family metallopeptidase [Flagellimonas sp. S3867]|uniref:M56 family metallopeptidase n=1 Tax=Flagellimonas sp. S3867 TaxID=2768063 RepID=UPI001688C81C|nr:M56 family metallopeptidase [Flagellimonas sp. S3867]